jgi:hypothetical protein
LASRNTRFERDAFRAGLVDLWKGLPLQELQWHCNKFGEFLGDRFNPMKRCDLQHRKNVTDVAGEANMGPY